SAPRQDTPEALLRRADLALYRAKAEGKARAAAFEPALERHARARLDLQTELREALIRNELQVYYQPIVSLTTGRILELEALVRWVHPRHGIITPGDFIPVAEETGLIVPTGRFVLEQACRAVAEWRRVSPDLGLSVNVSARQFQDAELIHDT